MSTRKSAHKLIVLAVFAAAFAFGNAQAGSLGALANMGDNLKNTHLGEIHGNQPCVVEQAKKQTVQHEAIWKDDGSLIFKPIKLGQISDCADVKPQVVCGGSCGSNRIKTAESDKHRTRIRNYRKKYDSKLKSRYRVSGQTEWSHNYFNRGLKSGTGY